MGIARQLASIEQGFKIVASFPEWRGTPIVLGESDPEGCAACSAKDNPQNSYRNGPLYAAYTAEALGRTIVLAERLRTSIFSAPSHGRSSSKTSRPLRDSVNWPQTESTNQY